MEILYFFESIRNTFCDVFFSFITLFGEETMFLLLVMLLLWCVDKRAGYYLSVVGFVGIFLNQSLKMTFRVPRPWVLDPEFTIVESAREAATGYSFPSGHTQSAVGAFGTLALWDKRKWVKIVSAALVVLVPVSRMYLGVHTFNDVIISTVIALVLVAAFYFLFCRVDAASAAVGITLGCVAVFGICVILYLSLASFPADVDSANLKSSLEGTAKLFGAVVGMIVGWFVDKKFLRYEVKAVWYAQILKFVLGVLLVFAVKELSRPVFAFLPEIPADGVRYFFIVLFGLVVWPMTFRFFSKMGKKQSA